MGVDIVVWRRRIAAFPNRGPARRRRRGEGDSLSNEGKWWRKQIFLGLAVLAAGLALFYSAPLCSYIVSQPSDDRPQPWLNQSLMENHQNGTPTNDDLDVPTNLLLLCGDIEVNPGPVNEDKKISWDDDHIIGMSSGTPTSSMWVFKQEQEKQELKQSEEEAEQAQKKAEEEEAKDKLKKEEDERKAKKREEEKAAWLQHLEDDANHQALEAEEKREAEKARVKAEEEEESKKKKEEETVWTPTESTNEPSLPSSQKSSLKPLATTTTSRPQPSSHNTSFSEDPMDPEVSK